MKISSFVGGALLVVASFLILDRATLAGNTVRDGDVTLTERDEAGERRLIMIGGAMGGLGLFILVAGSLAATKDGHPR